MKPFSIALLTEVRFVNPEKPDWYVQNIIKDDALLSEALLKFGITTKRVDWADPDFDWSSVKAAVFRTTWDYFEKIETFKKFLDQTEKKTRLFNDSSLIRWNFDKHYLLDLEKKGVQIPPTKVIEQSQRCDLENFLKSNECDEGIVKPAISGAAWNTFRFSKENRIETEQKTNKLLETCSMLLQPFQKSITQQGELSLILIGGKFTHAVRKVPKQGDFRVQDDHGGKVFVHEASHDEITFAEQALSACSTEPLYARVDLVRDNLGRLSVMELELIEPELFLRFYPKAAELFAAELASRL